MSNLGEYFQTDWAAMSLNDWIGTFLTVAVFFLMVWTYFYVFNPKNKQRFESQRHIPFEEDKLNREKKDEQ